MRDGVVSEVLLNTAYGLNMGMTVILPCVFRSFEREFNLGPKQLGSLTLCMWLAASLVSIFWGFAADSFPLGRTLGAGMAVMGVGTLGLAVSETLTVLTLFTATVGIGISSVIPVVQKFISDAHVESERGRWYGVLGMTGALGGLVSSFVAISTSNIIIIGVSGWRLLFGAMGIICLSLALLSFLFLITPIPIPHPHADADEERTSLISSAAPVIETTAPAVSAHVLAVWFRNLIHLMRTPTVVAFAISWTLSALVYFGSFEFVLLWLQYIGFTDTETAVIFAFFQAGTGVGQLFGGWYGDWMNRRYRNVGRPLVSELSFSVSIVLVSALFWIVPPTPDRGALYAFLLTVTGVFCNLSFAGCDLPVMAEVVTHDMRASAVGVLQALSGIVGAFGAYLVGAIAQDIYGYVPTNQDIAIMDPVMRSANQHALSEAVAAGILIPWAGNLLAYAYIMVSYPADRDRVRVEEHNTGDTSGVNDEAAQVSLIGVAHRKRVGDVIE